MKFQLTGKFGEMSLVRDFQPHSGIDFGMPEGTTLRSVVNGTVRLADYGAKNAGKTVMIEGDNGNTYIYGHMRDFSVKNGSQISAGDVIGHSGNTGHSTAAHLHFGMKDASGHFVDPTPLADKVSNLSGDNMDPGILNTIVNSDHSQGIIGKIIWNSTEGLREHARDVAMDIALGICDALADLLVGATLIGSAVCILLKVCGWRDGGRWAGILIGSNVLLKFLLGK
jgi:hypothetical protein